MRTSSWVLACVIVAVGAARVRAQSSEPSAVPADGTAASTQPTAATTSAPPSLPPAAADTTAPPADSSLPAEALAPMVPAAEPVACIPSCRTGFTCLSGSCVSSCNPPCPIGDVCSNHAECVSTPVPPLSGDAVAARVAQGVETHDGFFLRLTTGPAGGAVSLDIPDSAERTYSGGGWSSSIDIGGALVRDVVIFGRLRGAWLFDPKVRDGDAKIDLGDDLLVTQGLIGAGINYYLMPSNIYFGGAIGFATITTGRDHRGDAKDDTQRSDVGFGIDLDAGKEWWVSDNWGLGAALRLSLASVPAGKDVARDAMFGSGFVSLVFSATYQ